MSSPTPRLKNRTPPPPRSPRKGGVKTFAVIGSGAWGAAFGKAMATSGGGRVAVLFWDRDPSASRAAASNGVGTVLSDIAESAVADAIIVAVSSAAFREVVAKLAFGPEPIKPIIGLSKGFDPVTRLPLCRTVDELLGNEVRFGVISGPSFAAEVAAGLPTALTLATPRRRDGQQWQNWLHRPRLRLYWSPDVIGVCVAGAVKNIIAIAAGIAAGMGLGENAQAALITRGLDEMGGLIHALGGRAETVYGLAGVGDTVLSCSSNTSRNRRFGFQIGKKGGGGVVPRITLEGVDAVAPVMDCAATFELEMPITRAVAAVLHDQAAPRQVLSDLLARPLK